MSLDRKNVVTGRGQQGIPTVFASGVQFVDLPVFV